MTLMPPDRERWRLARQQFRAERARERLDEALGRELERLPLAERIALALQLARDVVGFALRDALEAETRYSLAASFSATIAERAGALAERATALLAELDAALAAGEALQAAPEDEWAKWSPPAVGPRPHDREMTAQDIPKTED
ncbi:MAG: hypothetical protein HYU88_02665 [Chloroflexi bacterium]|nr:hypothetical protein [Chloroflexota bacterium]MBI4505080.1 hypothetical protein [Chloroflexota bacterium]